MLDETQKTHRSRLVPDAVRGASGCEPDSLWRRG